MQLLKEFLDAQPSGPVDDVYRLEQILATYWSDFKGHTEGGMHFYQLILRMEDVVWEPPMLRFAIERPERPNPSEAEVQHWELDLNKAEARIVKVEMRGVG